MQKKSQPASEIAQVLRKFRHVFIAAGVFTAVINLLMLTPIIYMLQVYDRVLASLNVTTLIMLTVIAAGLYLLLGLLESVRGKTLTRMGNQIDAQMNERVFRASYQSYLHHGNGNAQQALTDFLQVRQFLTGTGVLVLFDAPWTIIYLAIIFFVHWILGAIVLVAAAILIALALLSQWSTNRYLNKANQLNIVANAQAASNLRNAEVIESMGMIGRIYQRWLARHTEMLDNQTVASERASSITSSTKAFRLAQQSLILGVGAWLVIQNELTPGLMIAASLLTGRALAPVEGLIGQWKGFVGAHRAHARLQQLFTAHPIDTEQLSLPAPRGHISVEALFGGPPGAKKPTVANINFQLPPGEILGIIGPSASGKSTLARLLVGIWGPLSGKVRLDGADIYAWDKEELGPHVGYLPQDIELFEGTVAENIARFGNADPERIVAAAQTAGVHELILRLPSGYDTDIGTGGAKLSGGQRQRIALARAIYNTPKLLVLDEPNSNLDDSGDRALLMALQQLKQRGTTIIVVSHRNGILNIADRLLLLKDGAQAHYGSRADVLAALQRQAQQSAPPSQGQPPQPGTTVKARPSLAAPQLRTASPE